MCGLFSLLQLRWKQHLLALKEAAHWATGGLGWVAVFWILNLHEFEWVSLTEIILSWSLINILHIKIPSGAKVLRHASFLYIFWFNFCYKESVNCNFFWVVTKICVQAFWRPLENYALHLGWFFLTYVQSSPCTWPFSMECFIFWLILTYTFNSS